MSQDKHRARPSALELRGLTKRYGSITAVEAVDLAVPRGQFLTLLGPSGSGKTTILMMIAGFIAPSQGDILLDGRRITDLPPEKRNFGMVFQGYALFPHLTVFDNVAFSLKIRRQRPEVIRQKVQKALELVQLQDLGQRMPRELSGGQQQRVALARALVFDPDVLLLDEPLGALDRKLRAEVQIELKQLHGRLGTTFIYVTHDQEEALSMSDRIAIVRNGRVVQAGAPAELYERPRSQFVAGFLGESNFLRGRVSRLADGEFAYVAGDQEFVQSTVPYSVAAGEEIVLAVRPEKIAVGTAPLSYPNRAAGRVVTWNYFGSSYHLELEVEGLGFVAALCPAWRIPFAPRNGMTLWLGWDADAAVVVEADLAAGPLGAERVAAGLTARTDMSSLGEQ